MRRDGDNVIVVVLNLSGNPASVTLTPSANAGSIDGTYVELFSGLKVALSAGPSIAMELSGSARP